MRTRILLFDWFKNQDELLRLQHRFRLILVYITLTLKGDVRNLFKGA